MQKCEHEYQDKLYSFEKYNWNGINEFQMNKVRSNIESYQNCLKMHVKPEEYTAFKKNKLYCFQSYDLDKNPTSDTKDISHVIKLDEKRLLNMDKYMQLRFQRCLKYFSVESSDVSDDNFPRI
jgi:hypothetical protein